MQHDPPTQTSWVGISSCSSEDDVLVVEDNLEPGGSVDVVDSMVGSLACRSRREVGVVVLVPRSLGDGDAGCEVLSEATGGGSWRCGGELSDGC